MRKFNQGRFIPKYPQKYFGNPHNIFFRSSWELNVMKLLDNHSGVLRWAAEEFSISYISPKDGRVHQYYPDFYISIKTADNTEEQWVLEVKPLKETKLEHAKNVYDRAQLVINEAKWTAAQKFCMMNGLKFMVITELDIFRLMPELRNKPTVRTRKNTVNKSNKTNKTTRATRPTNSARRPKV